MTRLYHPDGTVPDSLQRFVWVLGSNLAGSHGAARVASDQFAAKHGVGVGRTGDAYALPTIDRYGDRLSLSKIAGYVTSFLDYTRDHSDESFWVTRVGCGRAGNSDKDIAPFFADAPISCSLPDTWRAVLK
jgi:hypothetical protein